MHIFIVGGTGRTGRLAIDEALSRGHTVTALVRTSAFRLPSREGLTAIVGSPLSTPDILAAFNANPSSLPDAVIVTLNATRVSDSPFAAPLAPPRKMADSHANIAAAMQAHGTKKIVTTSAFGVADSGKEINCLTRVMLRKMNMVAQFADYDAVDEEMKMREGLCWVLARPCMLKEGEALPVRDLGDSGKGARMMSSITRRNVAGWLVDAVERDTWDRRTPVLAN